MKREKKCVVYVCRKQIYPYSFKNQFGHLNNQWRLKVDARWDFEFVSHGQLS
mgnify:FL=1